MKQDEPTDARGWLETVVSAGLASEILNQRRLLKKPMGPLAGKGFAREIGKIPEHMREAAVEFWAMKGWQGFEAEWVMGGLSKQPARRGIVGAAINMVNGNGQENGRGFGAYVERLPAIAKH